MAESPLEAAAKPVLRALYGVRWDEATDLQQLPAKELARAAIAAYEAEQPAPDLDELWPIFEGEFWRNAADQHSGEHSARAGLRAVLAHLKGETR